MAQKQRDAAYHLYRLQKREARWNRPISGAKERLRAYADLMLVDHGVLRLIYLNFHRVTPGIWRSAQPAPHDIKRLAAKGLKTIVNLRGGRCHGAWQLEKETTERQGIAVVDLVLRSREAPDKAMLLSLPAFFAGLAQPVLAHCKSGADRAGLFGALYLLVVEKASAERAMRELSLRKGHFRFAQTGILDAFLEAYRDEGEANGKAFLDWVREDYDPEALKARFKPRKISSFIADRVLKRE